jgi:outer membrane murein-binding lipoprotein Lpp
LRQAQIKAKEAEKKAEQKDLEAEKAAIAAEKQKMETIIKGAEGIIGAGAKKDVAAGAISLAGTLTSLYFDDKLDQLNIKVAQLDSQIAALETTYAMEDVKQAKDDIKLAMNEVKKALPDLDTAVAKQEAAYNDFGASIEAFAKKLGLSADDVKTIRTAAAALPMIDETIGQISQIEAACEIPGYSSSSGLGAGLITNLDTFKTHLANLKAFKAGLSQLKQKWEARRAAARSGSGLPPNPAAP